MAELVKFETKELPKLYEIGKELRYSMDAFMKGDNPIPEFWRQCMDDRSLDVFEKEKSKQYEDAQVGLMCDWERGDGNFSYVIGMMFTQPVDVPEGYVQHILEPTKAAVAWIKGKDTMDCCMDAHAMTEKEAQAQGCNIANIHWSMEFYVCPRFTEPDENGDTLVLVIDSDTATFNEETKSIEVAPMLVDGATYIPYRIVCDFFEIVIDYDSANNIISVGDAER